MVAASQHQRKYRLYTNLAWLFLFFYPHSVKITKCIVQWTTFFIFPWRFIFSRNLSMTCICPNMLQPSGKFHLAIGMQHGAIITKTSEICISLIPYLVKEQFPGSWCPTTLSIFSDNTFETPLVPNLMTIIPKSVWIHFNNGIKCRTNLYPYQHACQSCWDSIIQGSNAPKTRKVVSNFLSNISTPVNYLPFSVPSFCYSWCI